MSTAVSSRHRQRPTPSITIATRGKGRSFKARASWYFTTATNTKRSAADNQHQVHHQQAEALVVGRPQLPRTRGRRLVPGSGSKPTRARVLRAHPAPELKATAKRAGRSRSVGHPGLPRKNSFGLQTFLRPGMRPTDLTCLIPAADRQSTKGRNEDP